MRKIVLILAALASSPGAAQQAEPTAEQVRADANRLISALVQQRNSANDLLAQAMAQVAKLTSDLEAARAASKSSVEAPPMP